MRTATRLASNAASATSALGSHYAVVIEPRGRARFPFTVTAAAPATRKDSTSSECEERPGKPLRPGAYTVELAVPFLDHPLSVPMTVKP